MSPLSKLLKDARFLARFFTAGSAVVLLEMCQNARSAPTDEGMVTGFLIRGNMFLQRLDAAI